MPCDYISWEVALIFDNLIIWIVDNETFCSGDGAVIESITYSSASTNWTLGIMAISDMHSETASITQCVDYGLGMMKYQGHKVVEACTFIHANCPFGHSITVR